MKRRRRASHRLITTISMGFGVLLAGARAREGSNAADDEALLGAMADSSNWASCGRDQTNQRYSPLGQLTPANVQDLQLAWNYRPGGSRSFEASPVVVGRTLYLSTPLNHVVALD